MWRWTALVTMLAACASNDGTQADSDTSPNDTDTPDDTDTPGDTDLPTTAVECVPFAECGGDVVGDWTFDRLCFPPLDNPFEYICDSSTYAVEVVADGLFHVADDNTYTFVYTMATIDRATFPAACNTASFTDCSSWDAVSGLTCTGDIAVTCTCELASATYPFDLAGTWSYDAGDVVFVNFSTATRGVAGTPARLAYCQDGDTMSLELESLKFQYDFSR